MSKAQASGPSSNDIQKALGLKPKKTLCQEQFDGLTPLSNAAIFINENVSQNDLVTINERYRRGFGYSELVVTVWYWKEY